MKTKEVLKFLQITRVTLCHYVKEGKIKVTPLHNGRYEYDEESVYKLANIPYIKEDDRKSVIYARTSNPPKKYVDEQINRLLQYCTINGITINKTYFDIKSGMNFDRKEFQELITDVLENKVKLVVIENKDRLCRFGFDLLNQLFSKYNCKILVVNDLTEKNFEQELTEDLISIIHYFSMKSYSHRRKLNKLKKELLDDNVKA